MTTSLQPGQRFARDFLVERRLSEGGMGAVYVARQLSTDKLRALKLMHPRLVPDEKSRQRFVAEARVGARIESEHVVDVVAAGVDEETGVPWLAMELLDGLDLGVLSQRRGPLPAGEVRDAFLQLGHALAAAHAQGIVHRDLKPENLFLARTRRQGQAWVLKVVDFGIATAAPSGGGAVVTTAVGSPLWMAPEQSRPGDTITPATDVWALGLIAFRLLTGRTYWRTAQADDASIGAVLTEVLVAPLAPASTRASELGAPALPPGFDGWFERCVVREPQARFADAAVAVRELDALLGAAAERAPLTAPVEPEPVVPASPLEATFQRATPFPAGETKASVRAETPPAVAPPSPRPGLDASPTPSAPPRSFAPRLALAVLLGGLVATAGWWFASQPVEPALMPAPAVALDAGLAETDDAGARPAATEVLAAGTQDAGPPDAGAVTARVASTRPAPAKVKAPPPPSTGRLALFTNEPCTVAIDGAALGQTPLEVALPVGKHVVRVDGPRKFRRVLEPLIAAGETTTLRVEVPAPTWVIEGEMDQQRYRFEGPDRGALLEPCLKWVKQHLRGKFPVHKMSANGWEMPLETAGIPAKMACGFALKRAEVR